MKFLGGILLIVGTVSGLWGCKSTKPNNYYLEYEARDLKRGTKEDARPVWLLMRDSAFYLSEKIYEHDTMRVPRMDTLKGNEVVKVYDTVIEKTRAIGGPYLIKKIQNTLGLFTYDSVSKQRYSHEQYIIDPKRSVWSVDMLSYEPELKASMCKSTYLKDTVLMIGDKLRDCYVFEEYFPLSAASGVDAYRRVYIEKKWLLTIRFDYMSLDKSRVVVNKYVMKKGKLVKVKEW